MILKSTYLASHQQISKNILVKLNKIEGQNCNGINELKMVKYFQLGKL